MPRIVRGRPGKIEHYPSFAELLAYLPGNRMMQCGSTYIHPQWLVTAGHCLDWNFGTGKIPAVGNKTRINVYMGADAVDKLKHKRHSIRLIIHHNHINFFKTVNGTYYDIGLLKVNKPFYLSATIKISTVAKTVSLNAVVEAIGFGETIRDKTSLLLQVVELKITQIDKTVLISSNSEGKNFCNGDSGGPLYLKSTKELVGIISTTYKECSYGVVKVLSFPDGVKKQITVTGSAEVIWLTQNSQTGCTTKTDSERYRRTDVPVSKTPNYTGILFYLIILLQPYIGGKPIFASQRTSWKNFGRSLNCIFRLSFDVVSLFTKVPLIDTLRYIADLFPPDITRLLKHCLRTSYFVWAASTNKRRSSDGKPITSRESQSFHGAV
ncbi:hypothetical protein Trydic_g1224 [Trypoxylus dichotomus]